MVKRILHLQGLDRDLVLSKVVSVDTPKPIMNLEQLPDGTWRLIYQKALIPDITKFQGILMVREDDE